jgi:FMNH2-dependent dimethyl sulfone monooxygenase
VRKPNDEAPLAQALHQPLMLGLFLPVQAGGWTPSSAPRSTSWQYPFNAEMTVEAERLGFDFVFGVAQWLPKDGYGGEIRYRADSLDPFILTAGLSAISSRIILISTLHILYGPVHPLHLARFGATIDHMSGGRWGVNIVTGFSPDEFKMFGMSMMEHDERYKMAAEYTDVLMRLWQEDQNLTFKGRYWQLEDAYVSPRPAFGRPIIVNAASSPAGIDFAARYADLIFITSPGGADIKAAIDTLPGQTDHIKASARKHGRDIRTIINPHILCRETEREAHKAYDHIVSLADPVAVDAVFGRFEKGDTKSWRGHTKDERVLGGNVHLIGTPEQVVDQLIALKKAGCDGVQINFFDYRSDLEFFGNRVLPLMKQAGLRLEN